MICQLWKKKIYRSDTTRLGRGGPVKNISRSWHFSQTAGIVLLKCRAMIPRLKMYQKQALVAFHTNRSKFVHFSSRCRKLGHKDVWRPLHYMLLRSAMSLWGRFLKYSASWALGDRGPELQAEQIPLPRKHRASSLSESMPPLYLKSRSVRAEFCSSTAAKAWHGDK